MSFNYKITYRHLIQLRDKLVNNIPSVKFEKKKTTNLDLVTNTDIFLQELIISFIKKFDDNCQIISEEGVYKKYIEFKDSCWVIDPLDGTLNYTSNLKIYCVSVAYIEDHKVMFSFVINLNLFEIFFAYRGNGAYFNGNKINSLSSKFLMNISTSSTLFLSNSNKLKRFSRGYALRNIGSQTLALCYLARGIFSCVLNDNAKIWDDIAAFLILKECNNIYYSKIKNLSGKFLFNKNLHSIAVHYSHPSIIKKYLSVDTRKRYVLF